MIINHENITVLLNSTDEEIKETIARVSPGTRVALHIGSDVEKGENIDRKMSVAYQAIKDREIALKKQGVKVNTKDIAEDEFKRHLIVDVVTMKAIDGMIKTYEDCSDVVADKFLMEEKLWILDYNPAENTGDKIDAEGIVHEKLTEIMKNMATDSKYHTKVLTKGESDILGSASGYSKQADKAILEMNLCEIVEIKRRINIQSSRGQYSCTLPETTSKSVLEYLRKKCFSIEDYVKGGKRIVRVHW